MKILVTGHKGFIGSNLFKLLTDQGHTVQGFEWGDDFPFGNYDAIMHIGALSSTNEKCVEKVFEQNYDFSVWLIEYANQIGAQFQYSSSASVYGKSQQFTEDAAVDPKSAYAWSKYLFERYVNSKKFNVITQGFRYFNVFGPGEEHKAQPSPFEMFSRTEVIKLFYGSEHIKRDFVHVNKVVSSHIEFLRVTESGIWNVGSGNPLSFFDVAASFNKPIEYIHMPDDIKTSYQYYTCADLTKLNKTIEQYGLVIQD